MEAKGCAKATVWKDARRHFYWALRARIARSNALKAFAEASPDSDYEYRTDLLESLATVEDVTDNQALATALEALDLTPTLAKLKSDHLMRRMLDMADEDRKATIGGLVRFVDNLTEDEKTTLKNALQKSSRSPGLSQLSRTCPVQLLTILHFLAPPSYGNATAS